MKTYTIQATLFFSAVNLHTLQANSFRIPYLNQYYNDVNCTLYVFTVQVIVVVFTDRVLVTITCVMVEVHVHVHVRRWVGMGKREMKHLASVWSRNDNTTWISCLNVGFNIPTR